MGTANVLEKTKQGSHWQREAVYMCNLPGSVLIKQSVADPQGLAHNDECVHSLLSLYSSHCVQFVMIVWKSKPTHTLVNKTLRLPTCHLHPMSIATSLYHYLLNSAQITFIYCTTENVIREVTGRGVVVQPDNVLIKTAGQEWLTDGEIIGRFMSS